MVKLVTLLLWSACKHAKPVPHERTRAARPVPPANPGDAAGTASAAAWRRASQLP
jgi:hypothetical protein